MKQSLFVYGSLRPDGSQANLLSCISGHWTAATVKGHFYPAASCYGANTYPGVVLDKQGEEIAGFIFSSDNLDVHWSVLDEYEGEDYMRVLATAWTQELETVEVYIYVLKTTPKSDKNLIHT